MSDNEKEAVELWDSDNAASSSGTTRNMNKKSSSSKKTAKPKRSRKMTKAEKKKEARAARGVFFTILAGLLIAALFQAVILPGAQYRSGKKLKEEGRYEEAAEKFEKAGSYRNAKELLDDCREAANERDYQQATLLLSEGKFTEAKNIFSRLRSYKDAAACVKQCDYSLAEKKLESEDFDGAKGDFLALGDFGDSAKRAMECDYLKARKLAAAGYYVQAWELLEPLDQYAEAESFRAQIQAEYERAVICESEVGALVSYGRYEQDNDSANGAEAISWIVLEKDEENGRVLLVSEKILDCRIYGKLEEINNSYYSVKWESSGLRSWLNGDFADTAFTQAEKELLTVITLSTASNPISKVSGGNATEDRLFVLSFDAVRVYFADDDARIAKATPFAQANGVYVNPYTDSCYWWLRNPGGFDYYACIVDYDGVVQVERGLSCNYVNCGVRPAMWVSMPEK